MAKGGLLMDIKLYLNPFVFLLIKDGEIVVWDYKNHNQYELEEEYVKRLIRISKGVTVKNVTKIDQDLINAELISTKPYILQKWEWDELSKIYHIGTQDIDGGVLLEDDKWVNWYLELCDEIKEEFNNKHIEYNGKEIKLPKPKFEILESRSMWDVEKSRMTTRSFNGLPITIEELSTILFSSFGLIHGDWKELTDMGFQQTGCRKSSPSGGALHPVEAYIFVMNVKGVSSGTYHYNIAKHCLTLINKQISYSDLKEMLCGQFFMEGCALGIFLVAHYDKVWKKYSHSRSYKDVYLDAGHLSQTCLLNATAYNFRTWISAWFNDTKVSHYLKISGIDVAPLFFIALGHGDKKIIPQKLENILKNKK
ncbi:MAG: hypothetical protein BGO76_01660 [Caedibacter sp. 38-128]|nr:MAG: hypothetical protein BGO76_01660 [Caedibacter sp. 38-128]